MALIAISVFDQKNSGRTEMTRKTLMTIIHTVDLSRHRVFIIDNASCIETKMMYHKFTTEYQSYFKDNIKFIFNKENVGTARAINQAHSQREPFENCIKMDNDVVIHQSGWVELMEEYLQRDTSIGIIGLKRKDCGEKPDAPGHLRSHLYQLPHTPGQRWLVGEQVQHVMGTCQMFSSALMNKIGYLWQPRLYGFDDVYMSLRSSLAGFKNVFIPQIEIDHIDPGGTEYTDWKNRVAGEDMQYHQQIAQDFQRGVRSLYVEADYK
jgi:GT2 family glycosyltransferase